MNSLVFLLFELGRAQAQLAEFFGKMPASSTKGVETESCHAIAHRQPVNLEPGAQSYAACSFMPQLRVREAREMCTTMWHKSRECRMWGEDSQPSSG